MLSAGDRYENFEIDELIGTGTFAWVYAARSPDFEHPIALKLSRHAVTSEEVALRALREIRILSSLSNPYTVHVYDHGLGADERWFMVMELLEGGELSAVHDFDRPLGAHDAIRLVYQACLGLDEAHRSGIVHRDLKPGNLWVARDGSLKVLDFGLARSWDDDSIIGANATRGHMLVGTPHYAQPEQVRSGKLSPASDVYSLGILLYELLTGRMPLFVDQTVSEVRVSLDDNPLRWITAHLERPVVPIERYPEGQALKPEIRNAIHACLQKDPDLRPASAGALAAMLVWGVAVEDGGYDGATGVVLEEPGDGRGQARRFLLRAGEHRIGLGPCCDVELDGDSVGWVFAILRWEPDKEAPELEPLRNDGFVRVDGHAIRSRTRIKAGAQLQFGKYALRVAARI